MYTFFHRQEGQTLVEILVALAAAVTIVTAITIAVITALSNAQTSKNQNLATQYAQEGIEIARGLRNTNFQSFIDSASTSTFYYCLPKGSRTLIAKGLACPQNVDTFVREVAITKNSASCDSTQTDVTVSVSWNDGKCTNPSNPFCHQVQLVTCLSDYTVLPTP